MSTNLNFSYMYVQVNACDLYNNTCVITVHVQCTSDLLVYSLVLCIQNSTDESFLPVDPKADGKPRPG